MTREELKAEVIEKYGEHFEDQYESELYRKKILDKCTADDPSVWDDVQNLYDKYCYINAGFDAVAIRI